MLQLYHLLPQDYIRLYYELLVNECDNNNKIVILRFFAANCDGSNCILIYIVSSSYSIYPCFYFYINSIRRQLQFLVFPPILVFYEKCTRRENWRNSRRGGWPSKVFAESYRGVVSWGSELSRSLPWWSIAWRPVTREMAVTVTVLFIKLLLIKLEIWKKLKKICP